MDVNSTADTMNSSKIITKTPGKLMLAGEWSILEPGNQCIVMAINRFLTATISPSTKIIIHLSTFDITLHSSALNTTSVDPRTIYCITAINTTLQFLQETGIPLQPFTLELTSDISTIALPNGQKTKPGLGSSAASVVATITSILAYHGKNTMNNQTKETIFKLAIIAHYKAQGAYGSGFDIAAATFGNTLVYQQFDKDWLTNSIKTIPTLASLTTIPWPGLCIKPIKLPNNFGIAVGFVGSSAKTANLLEMMNSKNAKTFHVICTDINNVVIKLEKAINTADYPTIKELIKENRSLLQKLSIMTGNKLETRQLKKLIQIAERLGAAAKFSGAGGGDCGIAIDNNQQTVHAIKEKWQDVGIIPLDITPL